MAMPGLLRGLKSFILSSQLLATLWVVFYHFTSCIGDNVLAVLSLQVICEVVYILPTKVFLTMWTASQITSDENCTVGGLIIVFAHVCQLTQITGVLRTLDGIIGKTILLHVSIDHAQDR